MIKPSTFYFSNTGSEFILMNKLSHKKEYLCGIINEDELIKLIQKLSEENTNQYLSKLFDKY